MSDTIEMGSFGKKGPGLAIARSNSEPSLEYQEQDFGDALNSIGTPTQQMNRNFGSLSILALSITLLASWEAIASGFAPALRNGGPSALVWGMLFSISGTMALALSLAEMASICPIAGAQYHWTALFAPPKIRAFMTWMQGWITVFGWQAAVTSICYLVAAQFQALVIVNHPEYQSERWHGTLIMWAVMIVTFAANVYAIKVLPIIQLIGGIFHVTFFVALIVPLVLLARRSTPDFVFETVMNNGGYESKGVSWCIGLLTVTYCFLGFDGAVHMSEEVRNPSIVIPKILVQTIVINGALAFGFVLVLLFCIGDVSQSLNTTTGFPVIEIFYQATGSKTAATIMMASITTIGLASNIGVVASVSRLTWAFARDGGLPFSSFFAKVDSKHHVPYRAIGLVSTTVVLLSLINVGSSTALSAILALTTFSLYLSYVIPIILLVMKRLRSASDPEPINFGPWTLGRWGIPINIYAILFGILVCIFVPFPPIVPVTPVNMNYSGPVFLGLMVFLVADWIVRGRKKYTGPLKELLEATQREEGRRRRASVVGWEERDGPGGRRLSSRRSSARV